MVLHSLRRVSGIALLLCAAGCAVGPNYHPVQATVPSMWPSSAESVRSIPRFPEPVQPGVAPAQVTKAPEIQAALPSEAQLGTWWNEFNDPLLTRLVGEALKCNLDIRRAEWRIVQSRASAGIVRSGFFPQINYNNSFQRGRNAVTDAQGNVSGKFFSLFRHGFDSAWELDVFGGTRRAFESANAQLEASEMERRNFLVTIAAEVGADYVSLRALQREIKIAHENLESQRHNSDITRQRLKGGFVTGLDVANADAQAATTLATIPAFEAQAQQLEYALAVLLGREPAALDEELRTSAPIPPPPPAIPVGLPSELLCRRPDVLRAQALVHAATANIGVAKADLFPKFSIVGNTGLQGPKAASLGNLKTFTWGAGPSLQWDAFAGGRIWSNIELQKALTEEQKLAYQQTVLGALQDVDNALIAFSKEREHHDALADAVTANLKSVDLSTTLYRDGKTDFLNVINAQRQLFESQTQLVLSDRDLALDIVALYKALGGGWEAQAEILSE